jgi:hypothetical protein
MSAAACPVPKGHSSGSEGWRGHRADDAADKCAKEVAFPPTLPRQAAKRGHSQTLDVNAEHAAVFSSNRGVHGAQHMPPSRAGDATASGHQTSPKRAKNGGTKNGENGIGGKGKRVETDVPTPMRLSQVSVLGIGVSDGHPRVGAQHPGPYLQQPGLYFGRFVFPSVHALCVHAGLPPFAAGKLYCAMQSRFWAPGVLAEGLVWSRSHAEGAPEDDRSGFPASEKTRTKAPAASKDGLSKGKTGRSRVKTNCGPASQWTAEEHARFLAALDKFGKVEPRAGAGEHCEGESAQRPRGGLGKSAILISSPCSVSIFLTLGASQGLEWQI